MIDNWFNRLGNNTLSKTRFYFFGGFCFDANRLELKESDKLVDLKIQPARLLKILLERAPETISRQEIKELIWNNGTIVEFDHGLNTCVNQLRAALTDTANKQQFIATMPKRGYRFVGDIRSVNNSINAATRQIAIASILIFTILALGWYTNPFPNFNKQQIQDDQSDNSSAFFDLLMRAKRAYQLGDDNSIESSLVSYDAALELNPKSVEAMGGKALSLIARANNTKFNSTSVYASAMKLTDQIRGQVGSTALSELVRGFIFLYRDRNLKLSKQAFDIAIDLTPESAMAHSWRAAVLAALGDVNGAAKEADLAVQLDPLSMAISADRCWYLAAAGRFEESVEACHWALEITPDHNWTLIGLVAALEKLGRNEEAIEALNQILVNFGGSETNFLEETASIDLKSLHCKIADMLVPRSKEGQFPLFHLAAFNAQCHRFETAIGLLEEAKSRGEIGTLYYTIDPRFDDFRDSPISKTFQM